MAMSKFILMMFAAIPTFFQQTISAKVKYESFNSENTPNLENDLVKRSYADTKKSEGSAFEQLKKSGLLKYGEGGNEGDCNGGCLKP